MHGRWQQGSSQECCIIADPYQYPPVPGSAAFESIGSFAGLEAVAEGSPWQDFERLAAFIFGKHGFETRTGIVKTRGRQRRQYDVIATRNGRTFLVECKQWSGSRYRLTALRQAVVKHRERAEFYKSVTNTAAVPVIVTLIEEEARIIEGVPLVPVHRLNAFIGELDLCTGEDTLTLPEEEETGVE